MIGVYHAGELAVQKLAGEEFLAEQNSKSIRSVIFKGAMAFIQTQSMVIASTVGENGKVWISFLTYEPGFISAASETMVTIMSRPPASDPLIKNLLSNPEIGLLAIDFNRRIRMRINGKGEIDGSGRLTVTTEQVYGNCPKYIQKRSLQPSGGSAGRKDMHNTATR